jgi:catechol 2,3-dioxygenase
VRPSRNRRLPPASPLVLVPYASLPRDRIGVPPPRFQLPDDTSIGRVTVRVADLDRSLAFYRDVIGFRLLRRSDGRSERSASLGAQADDRVLLELREHHDARRIPHRGRIGIYHFAVLLPSRSDLGAFLRHAAGAGAHISAADHFFSEATYLTDPDGITIEVYRDRPRPDWVVNSTGELVGPTERLDFEGILKEAPVEPYRGLPAGTTIGHMHFYVGDLSRAEAFYHAGLGFTKVNWTAFPGILFVSAGGYHHHVALNTFAADTVPAGADDAGLVSWQLRLPDEANVSAVVENLRRAGVDVRRTADGYESRDDWGLTVELVANR